MSDQKPQNVKCPDCDGPMVSRKSTHGVFWGCRSFPACRGTRDSMGRSKQERKQEEAIREEEGPDADNYRWDR